MRRVVITGMGCVSALGSTAKATPASATRTGTRVRPMAKASATGTTAWVMMVGISDQPFRNRPSVTTSCGA